MSTSCASAAQGSVTSATSSANGAARASGAAAGGQQRLAAVYAAYRPVMLRRLAGQVRAAEGQCAEDLAQEVFLRAGPALGAVRDEAALSGWLAAVGRRVVADHYRDRDHRGGRRAVEAPVCPQRLRAYVEAVAAGADATRRERPDRLRRGWPVWASVPAAEQGSAAELEHVEQRVDVAAALSGLPAHTRRAVTLRVVDGLAWADVAARLGRGKAAARRLAEEGLTGMRAHLADTDHPPPASAVAQPATTPVAAQTPPAAAAAPREQRRGTVSDERAWLSTLARHALAQPGDPAAGDAPRGNPAAPAEAGSSPGGAGLDARRRAIAGVVAGLPAQTRRVVALRFARGLPVHVVAEQVGRSRQTVHAHTLKALSALRAHLVDIDTHLPDIHPAKADSTGPAPIGSVATAGCAAGGGAGLVRARAAVAGLAHHQQAAAGAAARQRTTRRVRAAQLAHRHTAEHITPIAGPRQRAAGRGGPTQAMDVGRGAG